MVKHRADVVDGVEVDGTPSTRRSRARRPSSPSSSTWRFFILYAATASYTRLLLMNCASSAWTRRTGAAVFANTATAQPSVATSGASRHVGRVQPPPVAMDDPYTGPAPSAYEAQTANYRPEPPPKAVAPRHWQ